MRVLLFHDHYDENHLQEVIEEMKKFGVPTIKAYETDRNYYMAVEGCHRLRACQVLKVTPVIEKLNWNDTVIIDLDGSDTEIEVSELIEEYHSGKTEICFDED